MDIVLGIESSCDETGAALLRADGTVLAASLATQQAEHSPFGGVIPELAARRHLQTLPDMVTRLFDEAGLKPGDLTAIAATSGPGLIGGLLVGAMYGKAMAAALDKPFMAINHLEGHALSPRLENRDLQFPYIVLLISGGHTQLLLCEGVGRYTRLGTTLDDAVGECFDKCASVLKLGQPGGPAIEKAAAVAKGGNDFGLPRPLWKQQNCNFSYSGLKSAVARIATQPHDVNELAWAVQRVIADTLSDRCIRAMDSCSGQTRTLVVAGGVAVNKAIRAALEKATKDRGFTLHVPAPSLCTDNGIMIAWAGLERYALGMTDPLSTKIRPRWPLDEKAAKPGAKA